MHSRDETRAVIDLFDGYIDVEEKEVNGEQKKTLTVKRLYSKSTWRRSWSSSERNGHDEYGVNSVIFSLS